ncbi:hypothetical protein SRHO_G00053490 [Serrasalmus rhombeus]
MYEKQCAITDPNKACQGKGRNVVWNDVQASGESFHCAFNDPEKEEAGGGWDEKYPRDYPPYPKLKQPLSPKSLSCELLQGRQGIDILNKHYLLTH